MIIGRAINFAIVTVMLAAFATIAIAEPTSRVYFRLEKQYVTADHEPSARWQAMQANTIRGAAIDKTNFSVASPHLPGKVFQSELINGIFMALPDSFGAEQFVVERLQQIPGVLWAEIAPVRYTDEISVQPIPVDLPIRRDAPPNDPYYSLQWSLHSIDAVAAWDITHGDTGVVIAIVDVGTDMQHRDLMGKRWINWPEATGLPDQDDDHNGFIDDVYGWDFQDNDSDPSPDNLDAHGTHVAGIASASTDNGYGIAGAGWDCRIMPIRAGFGSYITTGFEGLIYAVASGADIVNLSWGSTGEPSNVERIAAEYALEQNVLVLGAAGNNVRGEYYPAAYDDVVAVAATTSGDIIAPFSNIGDWVAMSAPGDLILSCTPSGFGLLSGTSMATPIVAGAAGLIRTQFPDWSAEQIALQLQRTSDPIDQYNPAEAGQIGAGRLNMFRALTEFSPYFGLDRVLIDDANGVVPNGVIDPGDEFVINLSIENLLTEAATPEGVLTSDDPFITIAPDRLTFGAVEPGETVASARGVDAIVEFNTRAGRVIHCTLTLTGASMERQEIPVDLTVQPPYVTHNNGNIAVTMTNFGAIGYWDYRSINETNVGEGFRFPNNGLSSLFHGSLMVGLASAGVSDCAYGDVTSSRYDFVPLSASYAAVRLEPGQLEAHAEFDDSDAENPLEITIRQSSYTFEAETDQDYLLVDYMIRNESHADFDSLYVGLYLDWDVVQAYYNTLFWNDEKDFGWAAHNIPSSPVYGAAVLNQPTDFHVSLLNSQLFFSSEVWSDSAKLSFMQSGFVQASSDEFEDWSQLIGVGPLALTEGDSTTVSFVLAAGDDFDDLSSNIEAARIKWSIGVASKSILALPDQFRIVSVYPQPFNSLLQVQVEATLPGLMNWSVYDLLGRQVISETNYRLNAGMFTIPIDFSRQASGAYFLHFRQSDKLQVIPVQLLK